MLVARRAIQRFHKQGRLLTDKRNQKLSAYALYAVKLANESTWNGIARRGFSTAADCQTTVKTHAPNSSLIRDLQHEVANGRLRNMSNILKSHVVETKVDRETLTDLFELFDDHLLYSFKSEVLSRVMWCFGRIGLNYNVDDEHTRFIERLTDVFCSYEGDFKGAELNAALSGLANCNLQWYDLHPEHHTAIFELIQSTLPVLYSRELSNIVLHLAQMHVEWNIDIPPQLERAFLTRVTQQEYHFIAIQCGMLLYSLGKMNFNMTRCEPAVRKSLLAMVERNVVFQLELIENKDVNSERNLKNMVRILLGYASIGGTVTQMKPGVARKLCEVAGLTVPLLSQNEVVHMTEALAKMQIKFTDLPHAAQKEMENRVFNLLRVLSQSQLADIVHHLSQIGFDFDTRRSVFKAAVLNAFGRVFELCDEYSANMAHGGCDGFTNRSSRSTVVGENNNSSSSSSSRSSSSSSRSGLDDSTAVNGANKLSPRNQIEVIPQEKHDLERSNFITLLYHLPEFGGKYATLGTRVQGAITSGVVYYSPLSAVQLQAVLHALVLLETPWYMLDERVKQMIVSQLGSDELFMFPLSSQSNRDIDTSEQPTVAEITVSATALANIIHYLDLMEAPWYTLNSPGFQSNLVRGSLHLSPSQVVEVFQGLNHMECVWRGARGLAVETQGALIAAIERNLEGMSVKEVESVMHSLTMMIFDCPEHLESNIALHKKLLSVYQMKTQQQQQQKQGYGFSGKMKAEVSQQTALYFEWLNSTEVGRNLVYSSPESVVPVYKLTTIEKQSVESRFVTAMTASVLQTLTDRLDSRQMNRLRIEQRFYGLNSDVLPIDFAVYFDNGLVTLVSGCSTFQQSNRYSRDPVAVPVLSREQQLQAQLYHARYPMVTKRDGIQYINSHDAAAGKQELLKIVLNIVEGVSEKGRAVAAATTAEVTMMSGQGVVEAAEAVVEEVTEEFVGAAGATTTTTVLADVSASNGGMLRTPATSAALEPPIATTSSDAASVAATNSSTVIPTDLTELIELYKQMAINSTKAKKDKK